MEPSFETIAAIRFGYGLSPSLYAPSTISEMLEALAGPDSMAERFPVAPFSQREAEAQQRGVMRRARKNNEPGAVAALKANRKASVTEQFDEMRSFIMRPMFSPHGLRERLVQFWSDHFTVAARNKGLRYLVTSYVEEAIRPNVAGNFRTLLRHATLHPAMLIYLDQVQSIGPNSKIGKKKGRGLNENLAREILELHTLGVGGGYSQEDVRQFAELLTGLTYRFKKGFRFDKRAAEPGSETVLGQDYGGNPATLEDIHAALDDLALHPDTARHIARKLVVHFISDIPDPEMVEAVATAFLDSDGDLMQAYTALLNHPMAWAGFGAKAKQPFDFIVSSLRAMGISEDKMLGLTPGELRRYFVAPLTVMGQPWQQANGPDGWPEAFDDWITPQGLAARVQWALIATNKLGTDTDPVSFALTSLAEIASEDFLRTIGYSESRLEGMALVLASAEFNRR